MRIFFLLSLGLALSGCNYYQRKSEPQAGPPETLSGLKAFRATVYPLVREKCVGCHGGTQAPLFAQQDSSRAYRLALAYADFRDPDKSIFVYRSMNGHCGPACRGDGNDMREAIASWWRKGQQADNPELPPVLPRTAVLSIPEGVQESYTSYEWELDAVRAELAGAKFSLELRRADGGSLRFRAPKLSAGARPIRIRAPRVWVNGGFDPAGDVYRLVETTVNPNETVVLGGEEGILSLRGANRIEVFIEFPEITAAEPNYCRELALFKDTVRPILDLKCTKCHSSAGTAKSLAFEGRDEVVCALARERASLTSPEAAPLISYPYYQRHEHPIRAIGQMEADTLLEWLSKERDAETDPAVD